MKYIFDFQATIENAIKRSKNADAALVESIHEVRGPGNTFIIIQSLAKSKTIAYQSIQVSLFQSFLRSLKYFIQFSNKNMNHKIFYEMVYSQS